MTDFAATRMVHGADKCPTYCYCRMWIANQEIVEKSPYWFKPAPFPLVNDDDCEDEVGDNNGRGEDCTLANALNGRNSPGTGNETMGENGNAPSLALSRMPYGRGVFSPGTFAPTDGNMEYNVMKNTDGRQTSISATGNSQQVPALLFGTDLDLDSDFGDTRGMVNNIQSNSQLSQFSSKTPNLDFSRLGLTDMKGREEMDTLLDGIKEELQDYNSEGEEELAATWKQLGSNHHHDGGNGSVIKAPSMNSDWLFGLGRIKDEPLSDNDDDELSEMPELSGLGPSNLSPIMPPAPLSNLDSLLNREETASPYHPKLSTFGENYFSMGTPDPNKEKRLKSGGNERFECNVCGTAYTCKSIYDRHLKRHSKCLGCSQLLALQPDGREIFLCENCLQSDHAQVPEKENLNWKNEDQFCIPQSRSLRGTLSDDDDDDDDEDDDEGSKCTDFSAFSIDVDDEKDEDYGARSGSRRRSIASGKRKSANQVQVFANGQLKSGRSTLPCDTCGKRFIYPARLRAHKESCGKRKVSQPNGNKEGFAYSCKECDCSFETRVRLREHLSNAHLKDSPFICEVCGQKFRMKHHMTHHKTKHMKKAEFSCNICGKLFGSLCSLRTHQRKATKCSARIKAMEEEAAAAAAVAEKAATASSNANTEVNTPEETSSPPPPSLIAEAEVN